MEFQYIQWHIAGHVAVITFNRPEVFHSFNRAMALEMQQALDLCQADEIRAVLIQGQGKAFCAGQDLAEVTGPDAPGFKTILSEHYNPIIERICGLRKPVVAGVNGVAAGAGANIALACDIVLASSQASFIQAFSKIGLVPDSGGSYFLPRLIGYQKALGLMLTGDKVSAEEADKMGMIYRVLPAETFETDCLAMAQQLAQMPTHALALTKRMLQQSMRSSLQEQLALEEVLQIEAGQTADYQEGVQAFMQKRKPVFTGR
ncbi:MAG: enoyl-CoA hydratase-related protein [Flavobacteriales bacterium]